jgi:phosphonate transport system substrate-binding protein
MKTSAAERRADGSAGASATTRPRARAAADGRRSSGWTARLPTPSSRVSPSASAAARDSGRAARALVTTAALLLATAVLAAPPRPARPPAAPGTAAVLRLGVVSFYNPRLMYVKYQPLVDYLSAHTPWRFELSLSGSYSETVARLCAGEFDVAYLGPFSYLRAHEACGARIVARLNTGGRATYTSYIMVRQDSRARTLADLRGATVGFGARLSTSSHLLPRVMLERAGLRAGRDIGCRYYGHHERATRAVLLGEVAACGVRDITGDLFTTRGLRVLARSEPVPNFPLAVGPHAEPALAAALVEALVTAPSRDPAAARAIAKWDPELAGGFAIEAHQAYAPVLDLARQVFGPRALTMPPEALVCGPSAAEPRFPDR